LEHFKPFSLLSIYDQVDGLFLLTIIFSIYKTLIKRFEFRVVGINRVMMKLQERDIKI